MVKVAEYVKIPKKRLELLLSDNCKLQKLIEQDTETKLEVDKELCQVTVLEAEGMKDPLGTWKARDIVKAIGRGFDPEVALELLYDKNELKIIDLKDFVGKSKNAAIRIKGRIIGRDGASRKTIEEQTNTNISIYGKTVCIIGTTIDVQRAAQAVCMLAEGSKHSTAFRKLESGR